MTSLSYIVHRLLVKPALTFYLRRDRIARYDSFQVLVPKGVFHPMFFFSTRILYSFLDKLPFAGRRFLEIGCGSGLLSMLALRKGALVTCLDIDKRAVEATRKNFATNFGPGHTAAVIESNVFSNLPNQHFDLIVINPPYYFKEITHNNQQAWYCGKEGEYFVALFSGLQRYMHSKTEAYMVLEEGCDLPRITQIAESYGIRLTAVLTKKVKWEKNTVFQIAASS